VAVATVYAWHLAARLSPLGDDGVAVLLVFLFMNYFLVMVLRKDYVCIN